MLITEVNRREFTMLAAGFAAAVLPVTAATITTDSDGLTAGEVQIPSGDFQMPAYRAMPATGKSFPVVLVVQEIFGVHEHIRDLCRRLAKVGYFAVAPELYARQGDVSKMENIQEIVQKVVSKVPDGGEAFTYSRRRDFAWGSYRVQLQPFRELEGESQRAVFYSDQWPVAHLL